MTLTTKSAALSILFASALAASAAAPPVLVFSSSPDNDLYRALSASGVRCLRFETPQEAVARAPRRAGVLILSAGYPDRTTPVDEKLFARARRKRLRLYVEFPAWLPGSGATPAPRRAGWERTVVASDAFGSALEKLRILAVHDCRFLPLEAPRADLVAARVAGFDRAVYGLPASTYPLLFELPGGGVLVSATKLSQFVTARYAPSEAWATVWKRVLEWLAPGRPAPDVRWTPTVRPSFGRDAALPAAAERDAFRRGADWFGNARMLVDASWQKSLEDARAMQDQVAPMPRLEWPSGDGSLGLLEGYNSRIGHDGTQPVRWWLRNDCMGESSMALAFAGRTAAARNLNDFIYFRSPLAQGPRADPASASYGLIGWNTTPKYYQDMDGFGVYYGDDNARALLGTLAAAALTGENRWDEPVLRCLLANLRTTGKLGFRRNRIDEGPLQKAGWRHYFNEEHISYSPHYQAYLWAAFLWAYDKTGYEPFFERSRNAIAMTMRAYPGDWHWTNGIQQERARMLLPLAWLVRLRDTGEHREWLRRIASDLIAAQDATGAIREEIGAEGKGDYGPPRSNEEYGKNEATLIQANGDPLADLLYTTNFAFLGLHEAAMATGEAVYRDAENRLAGFLTRIQARSETHPELDGAWFRAFDFRRWEFWASNADAGWGAWSVETGWTQAWITSVLAMRDRGTSYWEVTRSSGLRKHLDKFVPAMWSEYYSRPIGRGGQVAE